MFPIFYRFILRTFVLSAAICLPIAKAQQAPLPSAGEVDADALSTAFSNPPSSAKPLVIWQWLSGVVTREGITADLEAFKKAGLGGVQNFQVGGEIQTLMDNPDVQIGNPKWTELMRFAMDECARLGLSYGTHNCPGWSSSGSPEVKVQDSMQKLIWTETKVDGGTLVSAKLAQAEVDAKWNFYQDVGVLAVPDLKEIPVGKVIDLTPNMSRAGELKWQAPAGKWIIYRFGHTTNGVTNHSTSPASGIGLECDKMSRTALDHYWAGYPTKLLELAGKHAGTTFSRIEIDSYEPGPQNWTPLMGKEFQKRRGYELLPWLPVLAGKTMGNKAMSKRFQQDWNLTISDLFADNYYLYMDELVRRTPGMNLLVQPYGGPFDTATAAGGQSLLCAEFWTRPNWGWPTVRPVTSAAHIYGKPLVYGEGFTCWPLSAWQDDPHSLKPVGDRAFSLGVNSVMLHAAAQNPWTNVKPGMTFGKWGTQFSPNQTWWNNAGKEWFHYLARSQALLQQGLFVGDLCYLMEGKKSAERPAGYAGDACGERAFLSRVSLSDGKLVLPDGMSYRVLVLPETDSMSLPVARKIRDLVNGGAIVSGPRPTQTPGLEGYPMSEKELKRIADEVWGNMDGKAAKKHRYGKGRVFWGMSTTGVMKEIQLKPDLQLSDPTDIAWIHKRTPNADIYFLSNQKNIGVQLTAIFRMGDRTPELWHADNGLMETASNWQQKDDQTRLLLELDPSDSVFVVFRKPSADEGPGLVKAPSPAPELMEVDGPWDVYFPAGWGAPEKTTMDHLTSWTENENPGMKYFSGTAIYQKEVEVPSTFASSGARTILDLGEVKNIAEVSVNGQPCGILWKPPFRAEITSALKPGKNQLQIRITNLWVNRMIGDEFEPEDAEWGEPFQYIYAPDKPIIGRFLAKEPQWLVEGRPRPSQGRRTFVSFKFFTRESRLLPSGLLGPVKLESTGSR